MRNVQLILKSLMIGCLFAGLAMVLSTQHEQGLIKVPIMPKATIRDFKAITLPEDSMNYYTTVFMPDNYKEVLKLREVITWFRGEPRLLALTESTHYTVMVESSPIYQTRFKKDVGPVPCIMVSSHDGKILFLEHKMPTNGKELADSISESLSQFTKDANGWRRDMRRQGAWNPNNRNGCPFPAQPCPPSQPPQQEPEEQPPEEEVEPEPVVETPQPKKSSIWISLLAGVLGAGASLASEFKREMSQ